MLKDYLEEDDKTLSAKEIIEKYAEEIKDLCKYDKDTKDTFGFVNTWWVFGEVAKKLNYQIFMAEVENVGYKRTKRGEKVMPNELFRVNAKGEVLVNDGVKKTALDKLREVQWD
jgi:type I restriction enzyme M protein